MINKLNWKLGLLAIAVITTTLNSCKKDDDVIEDPHDHHEEELITTLTLTFVDAAGVEPTVTATFRDPDGDGGLDPDIHDTIRIADSTTYNVSVTVLNESETPAEDLTHEIENEADEHLFCYSVTGADVGITRTDTDGTYEVGLESDWFTGMASNGTVQVVLKHQPNVKNGNCDPGETDIDVTFVTEVQ
ncbi:MAG: type 1 periplasmic binding fold superfamily protein [Salibacteraceae bacterium]